MGLRFSAFGNLFTLWSVPESNGHTASTLPESVTLRVLETVRMAGYVYVEQAVLHTPYSGKNPHIKHASWWIRFFDFP